MTPVRVQRQRTKGWRMPPDTVYVGRGTVFGNPCGCAMPYGCPSSPLFEHFAWADDKGNVDPLRCCVAVYRHYVETGLRNEPTSTGRLSFAAEGLAGYPNRKRLIEALPRLRGKNLACWCALDRPCHADVLLEIVKSL
jgi:hypothetical protein